MSPRWRERLRHVPSGVLVIAAALLLLGAGLAFGGVYLVVSGDGGGWMVWLGAIVAGTLAVYVALQATRLHPWSWTSITLLFGLLLLSTIARGVVTRSPVTAAGEALVEGAVLFYLTRPSVRRAYGR